MVGGEMGFECEMESSTEELLLDTQESPGHQSARRNRLLATAAGLLLFAGGVAYATSTQQSVSATQKANPGAVEQKFGFSTLKSFFGVEEESIDTELSPEMKKKFDAAMELAKNNSVSLEDLKKSDFFKGLTEGLQNTTLKARADLDTLAPAVNNISSNLEAVKKTVKKEVEEKAKEVDELKEMAKNASKNATELLDKQLNATTDQIQKAKKHMNELKGEMKEEAEKAKKVFNNLPGLVAGQVGSLQGLLPDSMRQCRDLCTPGADGDIRCSNKNFLDGICISCKGYNFCCNEKEDCDCGCIESHGGVQESCGTACKDPLGKDEDTKCHWSGPIHCGVFKACFHDNGNGIFTEQNETSGCKNARLELQSKAVC